MHEELAGRQDAVIFSINSGDDGRDEIAQFWDEQGLGYQPVVDPPGERGRLAEVLGVIAYPSNIVVGPDGTVLHASYGFPERKIRTLLGL